MSLHEFSRSGRRELIDFRGTQIQLISDRAVSPESGAVFRVGDLQDLLEKPQGNFDTTNEVMEIFDGEIIEEGSEQLEHVSKIKSGMETAQERLVLSTISPKPHGT